MYRRALPLAVIALAQLAILVLAAVQATEPLTRAERRAERSDVGGPFPLELRSPQVVAGTSVRVLVALGRPSLAELNAKTPQSPLRQRAYVRSLEHEERALMSALTAKGVDFGQPVLFERVWSGFAATIATKDLPAVQTLGLRVEPVDRFYPAQVPAKKAPAVRPLPTVASDQRSVAVLDAFPSEHAPKIHGSRARPRIARPHLFADELVQAGDDKPSIAEAAGRRVAAVVHGELPKARLERIRVAGSQPLESGKFEVYGTTDQVMAGLERVVDPDRNGDATDAIPVAVTGLSAPYSGFEDSAVAEAVDGASELGTLVVAPAGNGGDPDGPFGSIGAPGAARGALTVGALDASGDPASASSTGPTYALGAKPDLAISGGAGTAAGTAWGTAIAAARVAGVAAALRAERPKLTAQQAAAALIGSAAPRGGPFEAGGGDPLLQAARATPIVAEPTQLVLRPGESVGVRIVALGGAANPAPGSDPASAAALMAANAKPDGLRIRVTGRGTNRVLFVSAQPKAKATSGRIDLGPVAIPYEIVPGAPPAPPLGTPHVILRAGKPDGVRFVAGRLERQDRGTSVIPVGNLVLTLDGPTHRELTPPGGARDLLPGEYAYTLTDEIKAQLTRGRYRFVLRARGTAGGSAAVRRSRSFEVS